MTASFPPRSAALAPEPGVLAPWLLGAALAAPWLWPWAPGPSAQVAPLLGAWGCMLLAAAVWLARPLPRAQAVHVVAGAWLAAALTSSTIGLLQWFGAADGWPGIQPASVGEAYANLRQRNQFASLVSIGWLALLYAHAVRSRPAGLAWSLAAVLLALGSAASVSRTGAVQWALICAFALYRADSRRLASTALLAYGAGVWALPALLQAIQGVDAPGLLGRVAGEGGCSSRLVLWSNVLDLIGQRPWLGWGAGELDYAHYATLYAGPRFCAILDNAHNLPLHLAVEFGLPLASAACGALAWAVVRARPWAERDPARLLAWGVLAVVGLHSLLEYPLWYGPFQLAVLLAVALLRPWRLVGARRPAAWLAVGAAALALGWAAAAYDRVSQAYLGAAQRRPAFRDDPLAGVRPGPFRGHAGFAELMLTPLHRGSAARVHALAGELLHFSPEPSVIQARIESAVMLERDDDALWHLQRFKAAFPAEHARWAGGRGNPP